MVDPAPGWYAGVTARAQGRVPRLLRSCPRQRSQGRADPLPSPGGPRRAYIHAIAARCGLSCRFRDFDYGIDLTVHSTSRRGQRYAESGFRLDREGAKARTAMSDIGWVDPRIGQVSVAKARSYLEGRGWRQQAYPGPELLVFEGPSDEGEPIIQVLPSSEQLADYRMR